MIFLVILSIRIPYFQVLFNNNIIASVCVIYSICKTNTRAMKRLTSRIFSDITRWYLTEQRGGIPAVFMQLCGSANDQLR